MQNNIHKERQIFIRELKSIFGKVETKEILFDEELEGALMDLIISHESTLLGQYLNIKQTNNNAE